MKYALSADIQKYTQYINKRNIFICNFWVKCKFFFLMILLVLFCLLMKIITAVFCRNLEVMHIAGRKKASRKLLRIKVTPDLHLTYSKNGGNLGLVLKMKNIACISILLIKHVKYNYLYYLNLFYTVL